MNTESTEDLYIANITKHETYSNEEKKFILKKLNDERLQQQKAKEASLNLTKQYSTEDKGASSTSTKQYSQKYKDDVLNHLNKERLWLQKREEMQKKRLANKKIYTFGEKEYYKFVNMEREYYLEKESCGKFYSRPSIVTLYYRTFGEMKKKDVLLKIVSYSEKIFISYDAIRVYFKPYSFEENR